MKFVPPDFVADNQIVYLKWGGTRSLKCQVLVAAGNMARVVNELHHVDRWVDISSLEIETQDEDDNPVEET